MMHPLLKHALLVTALLTACQDAAVIDPASLGDPASEPPTEVPSRRACAAGLSRDDTGTCAAWQAAGDAQVGCRGHSASLLDDGRVLLIGSCELGSTLLAALSFDPASDRWQGVPAPQIPRTGHCAVRLDDGRVLISGGRDEQGAILASVEIYDPHDATWLFAEAMQQPRAEHACTRLADGMTIVGGGVGIGAEPGQVAVLSQGVEVFHAADNHWVAAGELAIARSHYTATPLGEGRVFFFGTQSGGATVSLFATAEIYDHFAHQWTEVPTPFEAAVLQHSATAVGDGEVLVSVGGGSWPERASAVMDASADWRPAAAMNVPRSSHAAALLPDGWVLLVGSGAYDHVTLAELVDPLTGQWRKTAEHSGHFYQRTLTALADGRALVVGSSPAEIYLRDYDEALSSGPSSALRASSRLR